MRIFSTPSHDYILINTQKKRKEKRIRRKRDIKQQQKIFPRVRNSLTQAYLSRRVRIHGRQLSRTNNSFRAVKSKVFSLSLKNKTFRSMSVALLAQVTDMIKVCGGFLSTEQ